MQSNDSPFSSWSTPSWDGISAARKQWQEAQLSPRDPRDALYHFRGWWYTHTLRVSLRSTFSITVAFYSSTCIVLYTHRSSKLNYRTASMRCFVSHTITWVSSTDFHTTNLFDVNWTVTVIIKVWLSPKLLMTPRLPPPAHRRGRGPLWQMDTNFRR